MLGEETKTFTLLSVIAFAINFHEMHFTEVVVCKLTYQKCAFTLKNLALVAHKNLSVKSGRLL